MKTVFLSLILTAIATTAEAALLAEYQHEWLVPHRNNPHVFLAQMIDDVDFDYQLSIAKLFTQPGIYEFPAVDHTDMNTALLNNPVWTMGFTVDTSTYEVPVPSVFSLNPSIDRYVLTVDALTPGAVTDAISTRWSIHGETSSVPEPAAAALLVSASLWMLRRRSQRCASPPTVRLSSESPMRVTRAATFASRTSGPRPNACLRIEKTLSITTYES